MSQDNIDKLYANYDVLSDALKQDKIADYELEYKEILNAVKGNAKEKKLAAQFIPKFFKHFPSLSDTAIDRQLDLCEDEDGITRRQVRCLVILNFIDCCVTKISGYKNR